ncbi:MAG: hypothetical protein M1829_000278 [Trizodia sp. TS-e1964]|nr:MAG: hypothetical protein M1829_000278 [Trizodia sp. TS-e1964]
MAPPHEPTFSPVGIARRLANLSLRTPPASSLSRSMVLVPKQPHPSATPSSPRTSSIAPPVPLATTPTPKPQTWDSLWSLDLSFESGKRSNTITQDFRRRSSKKKTEEVRRQEEGTAVKIINDRLNDVKDHLKDTKDMACKLEARVKELEAEVKELREQAAKDQRLRVGWEVEALASRWKLELSGWKVEAPSELPATFPAPPATHPKEPPSARPQKSATASTARPPSTSSAPPLARLSATSSSSTAARNPDASVSSPTKRPEEAAAAAVSPQRPQDCPTPPDAMTSVLDIEPLPHPSIRSDNNNRSSAETQPSVLVQGATRKRANRSEEADGVKEE